MNDRRRFHGYQNSADDLSDRAFGLGPSGLGAAFLGIRPIRNNRIAFGGVVSPAADKGDLIVPRLLAMIGQPYEEPDGCIKFLKRALAEFSVSINGEPGLSDARLFVPVKEGSLGTVVVWKGLSVAIGNVDQLPRFHVGLMLDRQWALQSSKATNGVGVFVSKGFTGREIYVPDHRRAGRPP
jgi:hypothetical protein